MPPMNVTIGDGDSTVLSFHTSTNSPCAFHLAAVDVDSGVHRIDAP
ncbi:MAG: hypothetical protein ACLSB9_20075 [Hydrogeniiclostridium mannosilyticum]